MTHPFDSVLVANRGEIAVRIIRSAQAAGYRTIAVYSEADEDAPHVALADEAVLIGPAPVKESYLNPQRILDAAARSGAEAIHPGYGFLSENAAFAAACVDAGLVFIGPSAEAIELMGNKAAAKRRMLEARVPCIPGYQSADQSDDALIAAARDMGMPIMVKAAAGGGGRGMRLVTAMADFPGALASARSEAENAFGSGELILEKAVTQPRHVEVQVFGDAHGNVIHLGERDCSVQRRHQKVVEEAPCPVMNPELRAAMGIAAVAAAQSIDYVGAGTVEFLLDSEEQFYFLEMNTRLQVEHPVTELVTGLDLVDLQLHVAQGGRLPCGQEDVHLRGHAMEVRLYAEDTVNDFLPASGRALAWEPPSGVGIRVDHGLFPGQMVSPFYDPMIAKIIAFGDDRDTARRRLLRALKNTVLFGITSNREFLIDVLERESFARGEATTAFIEEEFPEGVSTSIPGEDDLCLAALLHYLQGEEQGLEGRVFDDALLNGTTGARVMESIFSYTVNEELRSLSVLPLGDDRFDIALGDTRRELLLVDSARDGQLRVAMDGLQRDVAYCFMDQGTLALQSRGRMFVLANELALSAADGDREGSGAVLAPMHGNLLTLRVAVGDKVSRGDELAVMEAMKMEHRLLAQIDGVVTAIHGVEGEQMSAGAVVLDIEAEEEAGAETKRD
ncbi:acetyl/propionyl/methylcrotonyl-CoA carboxylase subunit alpha [Congregibacter litoralis]|uniref:Biotin carboxylase n=1 Tax=Congregibacter litoralis KT71 TaxID=314285 RepID=A4ABE8_9GAMM|nr:acetyl-CoA carboxylase biotin carboxylase subunit [Congregibacter litoralis]EAQ96702.1 Acetyl/propionyl-CoA carboxylase, alpha subunit [Congregibacter litoralis KT71]